MSNTQAIRLEQKISEQDVKRSWLLLAGVMLTALIMRAPITAVGPIVSEIQEGLGLSGAMSGLLTTLPLLAFAFISPFTPNWSARIGIENTMFYAMLVLTGAIMLRTIPAVPALYAGTALMGMGIAVGNVLVPSIIKRDYSARAGLLTGIYTVVMNLGGAVASGLSIPLTEQFGMDWNIVLGLTAVLALFAMLAWLPQRKKLQQSSGTVTNKKKTRSIWRSKVAWLVTFYLGLQSFCFYNNITWIPEMLIDRGLTRTEAGFMLSLLQIVGMPSTFIVPLLASRRKSQRRFALTTGILFFIGYMGLLIGSTSLVALWIVLVGTAAGAGFGLAVMFFVLRTNTAGEAAQMSGMAQSIGYLLAAFGPFIFGWLHDLTKSWNGSLIMLLVVTVAYCFVGWGAGADRKTADC